MSDTKEYEDCPICGHHYFSGGSGLCQWCINEIVQCINELVQEEKDKQKELAKQEIQNQFVTYEIAKELEILGFDKPCFGYYHYDKTIRIPQTGITSLESKNKMHYIYNDTCILAPLWQQTIEYFREKYNIVIEIYTILLIKGIEIENSEHEYSFKIIKNGLTIYYSTLEYNFYNNAKTDSILKVIELCKMN